MIKYWLYKAFDAEKQIVKGRAKGKSRDGIIASLQQLEYEIIEIQQVSKQQYDSVAAVDKKIDNMQRLQAKIQQARDVKQKDKKTVTGSIAMRAANKRYRSFESFHRRPTIIKRMLNSLSSIIAIAISKWQLLLLLLTIALLLNRSVIVSIAY